MFEQSLLRAGRTHRPWTVSIALLGEAILVWMLAAIPVAYVQRHTLEFTPLIAPPPPRAAARQETPPRTEKTPAKVEKTVPRRFVFNRQLIAPAVIPQHPAQINTLPPALPESPVIAGLPGGVPGGQPGGAVGGLLQAVTGPPPPPPPEIKAPPPKRVEVGGQVQAGKLLHETKPAYPPLARAARIAGTVQLRAIISADGKVERLSVISGHPLLVKSALDAVKQWVYRPTFLNGKPVEVATEIDVQFNLLS